MNLISHIVHREKLSMSLLRLPVFLILALAISSCVSSVKNLSNESDLTQTALSDTKSIVFGEVLWLENGKQKQIGHRLFDFYIKPSLLRLEDKSRILCDVGEKGDFVWALGPGTYVINRIEYRDTWSGNYFFVPQIGFRISEPQRTYYIGTVEADVETKRDLIGGLSGKAKFTVFDHSDSAFQKFSLDHEISPDTIEKSLMVHDKGLPKTFDTTAEFNIALQLLNGMLSGM